MRNNEKKLQKVPNVTGDKQSVTKLQSHVWFFQRSSRSQYNALFCLCGSALQSQSVNNRFGPSQTRRNQCHEVFQSSVKFGSCTSDEWFLFDAGYTFLANDGWKLVHLLASSWHLKLQISRKRLQKEHFPAFNRDHQLSPHSREKIFYLGASKYNVLGAKSAQTGQGWWDVHKDPAMDGFSLHIPVTHPPEFCSMIQIQNLALKK